MKWLKILLVALGALVLLLAVGIGIVVATFDPNAYKGEIEQLAKERTGRTLKFHGDIELALWPSIGAKIGKVTLSRRASEHDFAAVDAAQVSVRLLPLLRGEVIVDQVSLEGLRASVIRAKGGAFDFEDLLGATGAGAGGAKPAPAGAPPTRVKFDVAGVSLTEAAFVYVDEGTGQRLEVQDLDLKTGRIAEEVPGRLSLAANVRGKLPMIDLKVLLEGTYRLGIARQEYALTGMDLKVSGSAAGFSRIALGVTGDARAQLAKEQVDADLVAKFDDTTVKAKLELSDFDKPRYGFDVDLDRIDLDRYLVAQPDAKPAPSTGANPKVEVDVPVDLGGLEGLRADGKLAIGSLKLMGLNIAQLKAQVRAADGRAQVAPHSAKLYEGNLEGALTLSAKGNRVSLKENLAGVAIGPLVKDLMERDAVEGKGDVAVDLSAAGPTVNAMKRSLAGTARVALKDGALKGVNLTEALRKTRAAFGSRSAEQQPADTAQRTDFSAMSASFVIKDGVARNDDLDVRAPLVRVGGSGEIDIGRSRLDYVAKASVVATAKGQGGADLEHLAGLTIPVKLTGSFDAPKVEIDYRAIASSAAKAKVEEKKAEVKEKAKERIEEKLRGLLRR